VRCLQSSASFSTIRRGGRPLVLAALKARDAQAALAEAVAQFNLSEEQRQRLAVREE
jgi:hypothetical protein